uniref:Putative FAD oxidase n=1 Tax=Cladonia uncialis subsp. uncialis TaxID=180999 RepID=A0A1Z1CJA4_CLAUC|nr:putative FAD oxidase [Cladonia uncialis subsp. uncialis]AUW31352.1 putative isoamyl alcohol oxidase [Cladonia uncialis subsp. uncialis]
MAPSIANETCDPFTPVQSSCTLGNMVSYSINASTPSDFSQTIAFAKAKNVRLVIRNTGHDYLGKSTGAGGLSIWTHYLKSIEFLNYTSPQYTGPAVKMGAGAQDAEIYAAADNHNSVVVGGDCATVGAAGGYTQGGGHSALSSKFGLAADQTLEWEVIDGDGNFLTATRTENPDLYWALSGGGGGTYGAVYSLTAKAYPSFNVTGAVISFSTEGNGVDQFFEAIGYYHKLLPGYTAAGGVAIAEITNTSFLLTPLTFPNMTAGHVTEMLQPFLNRLDELGIFYQMNVTESSTFLEHYNTFIEPNPTQLVENAQYGGRFIPLSVIQENNDELTAVVRNLTQEGVTFVGIGLNVSAAVVGNVYNSAHPSWRDAALVVILTTPWPNGAIISDMENLATQMTNKWVPSLTALAPESGCYMSEADPHQPDWKEAFYGPNYPSLYSIKMKYDPDHIFYAPTAVGSDDYEVQENGGLCWSDRN